MKWSVFIFFSWDMNFFWYFHLANLFKEISILLILVALRMLFWCSFSSYSRFLRRSYRMIAAYASASLWFTSSINFVTLWFKASIFSRMAYFVLNKSLATRFLKNYLCRKALNQVWILIIFSKILCSNYLLDLAREIIVYLFWY